MLQYITHYNDHLGYVEGAEQFLKGGGRWLQLRMKDASEEVIIETGKLLNELCKQYGATFIIDDHVELVKIIGADGVHIGKNDMPADKAREILGNEVIIGGTANTFEDIVELVNKGVNYIGLGPFRFTTTKKNLSSMLGIEGYEDIVAKCKEAGINIPIVAIGGINAEDITSIMRTGINGIAVSGTILNASDPVEETKRLINIIDNI